MTVGPGSPTGTIQVIPVPGLPEITEGSDLAEELAGRLPACGGLREGDVLVVSSKLVSKALGLRRVAPADRTEVVRGESVRVVAERVTPAGLTQVVESLAGPVLAAAGVDASNTGPLGGLLLLPHDPDEAARDLHARLRERTGTSVPFGLLLSDTAGRPWRDGQTDLALGACGVRVVDDLRGGADSDGRELSVTSRAVADEIAAAADLAKGKASGTGAALVRGLPHLVTDATGPGARTLVRTGPGDWFSLGHREAVRAALGAPPGTPAAEAVGLPSVLPEAAGLRLDRACRLALLGHDPGGVRITGSPSEGLLVTADDPALAGRVAARLEVALASEDLHADVEVLSPPAGG
ncbi:coenzyme F420-0:L-glutamate ligase [Serinicoccus kebangsaanensis]|uniref:coenzyme F420-0:L-glutamate ligase n=1 Tax=Serinicoccus kebangsaanensis TaxID=2602069 RepID=UPI00124F3813|nr:coenzyme F420-0:L-glutamate ligase [Serinicoccus kebangsaanensis]